MHGSRKFFECSRFGTDGNKLSQHWNSPREYFRLFRRSAEHSCKRRRNLFNNLRCWNHAFSIKKNEQTKKITDLHCWSFTNRRWICANARTSMGVLHFRSTCPILRHQMNLAINLPSKIFQQLILSFDERASSVARKIVRLGSSSARTKSVEFDESLAQKKKNAPQKSEPVSDNAYGWILHPVLDLLFCCGGIVWIFFVLHYFGFGADSISKPAQVMIALASLGAIGLSETHVMGTIARAYKGENFEKYAPQTKIAAVACIILAIIGCIYPVLVPVLLKIYLLFVAQHFTAQTFGLTMLYCAKRKYYLNTLEKRVLATLMQSTMCVAVLRQLTFREWSGENLLGFALPFWGALPEWICHAAEFVVVGAAVALLIVITNKWKTQKKIIPLPAAMIIITGVSIFLAGKNVSQTLWIYVPALFHGSQYICISLALHLKEKGLPEGVPPSQISSLITEPVALRYLGMLLIGALVFFQLLPFLAGQIGLNSAAFAASTFAAIHFHHFITDRAIWKLRDPETRRLLVS